MEDRCVTILYAQSSILNFLPFVFFVVKIFA
jgi:hypothetical protein